MKYCELQYFSLLTGFQYQASRFYSIWYDTVTYRKPLPHSGRGMETLVIVQLMAIPSHKYHN